MVQLAHTPLHQKTKNKESGPDPHRGPGPLWLKLEGAYRILGLKAAAAGTRCMHIQQHMTRPITTHWLRIDIPSSIGPPATKVKFS